MATGVVAFLTRRGLTRLIDRGRPERVLDRQLGRMASIVVVVAGIVWALGVAEVDVDPLIGPSGSPASRSRSRPRT